MHWCSLVGCIFNRGNAEIKTCVDEHCKQASSWLVGAAEFPCMLMFFFAIPFTLAEFYYFYRHRLSCSAYSEFEHKGTFW